MDKRAPEVVLVHIMDPLRPAKGGAVKYTLELLKHLIHSKKWRVMFLGTQDLKGYPIEENIYNALKQGIIDIRYISLGGNIVKYYVKLVFYVLKFKPKKKTFIIHVQRPLFALPFILFKWKFTRSHIIITVHAKPLETIKFKSRLLYYAIRPIYGFASRLIFHAASLTIFVSHSLMNECRLPDHIKQRCLVIPTGVDINVFKPATHTEKMELRKKYKIPENAYVVLFVGRLEKIKRVDFLIRAVKVLVSKGLKNITLIIVGDGSQYQYLSNLVKKLGIEENVLLTGFVPPKDIVNYYKVSDLLCLPSVTEASPNVIKEALACGIPFIATATSDELIKLSSFGVGLTVPVDIGLEDFANKIISYLEHIRSDPISLSMKCRKVAELLSTDRILGIVERIYVSLLSR